MSADIRVNTSTGIREDVSTDIPVDMSIGIRVDVSTDVLVGMSTDIRVDICLQTYVCTFVSTCVQIRILISILMSAHVCTHMSAHTSTHTCHFGLVWGDGIGAFWFLCSSSSIACGSDTPLIVNDRPQSALGPAVPAQNRRERALEKRRISESNNR